MKINTLYAFVVDVVGVEDEAQAKLLAKNINFDEVQKAYYPFDNSLGFDVYLDKVAVIKVEAERE